MTDALARYLTVESEDDLTRIVFGVLELLGPVVLSEILNLPEEALSTGFSVDFHTRIDPRATRVPDVLISDAETTVMIEAKRGTDIDQAQLRAEHADLCRFGNDRKRLVLVTGHESRPAVLDEIDLEHVEWLGWREIALRISNYDRSILSETQRQLVDLLQIKLEGEGYMPFAGFSEQVIQELPTVWELSDRYYTHIARLYRALEGRLAERGLQAKNVWRDGISQDFNRFPSDLRFVTSHLWIAYGEPDVAVNNKDQHYLFVAFCVEDGSTPLVRIGYSLSPKQNQPERTRIIENADDIAHFVTENDLQLLYTDRNFHAVDRIGDAAEMTSHLTSEDTLSNSDRVQIVAEYGSGQLADPQLTKLVAEQLVTLHEFSYPRLYP